MVKKKNNNNTCITSLQHPQNEANELNNKGQVLAHYTRQTITLNCLP